MRGSTQWRIGGQENPFHGRKHSCPPNGTVLPSCSCLRCAWVRVCRLTVMARAGVEYHNEGPAKARPGFLPPIHAHHEARPSHIHALSLFLTPSLLPCVALCDQRLKHSSHSSYYLCPLPSLRNPCQLSSTEECPLHRDDPLYDAPSALEQVQYCAAQSLRVSVGSCLIAPLALCCSRRSSTSERS